MTTKGRSGPRFDEARGCWTARVDIGAPTRAVAAQARRRGFLGKTVAGRPGEQISEAHEGDHDE